MRLSAYINDYGRLSPYTLGTHMEEGMVRLPRRLTRYLSGARTSEEMDLAWNHLRDHLSGGNLPDLLDQAGEFCRARRAFRRRPQRAWRVGDPCYITGEGHGKLFFVQVINGSCISCGDGWESSYKLYRPTFLELFGHLVRDRWNLRLYEARANRYTPKQLREQSRGVQREVKEAARMADCTRTSLTLLEAWMRS